MNLSTTTSNSLARTFRYIEWMLLLVYFLLFLYNRNQNVYAGQPVNTIVICICIAICFILSFIFPYNRPIWQKLVYIFSELIPIILVDSLGLGWDVMIYFILAKSCFLLSRRYIILVAIVNGIIWNLIFVASLPGRLNFERSLITERIARLYDTKNLMTNHLINNTASYAATAVFVILLSFVVVSERKSRERAESLAKEVETLAATVERTRIAREIHDSLGHTLTTLDVQLELAQKLRSKDSEKALAALDIAKMLASKCLQDVRNAVETMRYNNFNLNHALNNLVGQLEQNQSFKIYLDVYLPQLPLQISHQIYCILQEGLTNIQKHANAKIIYIKTGQMIDGINIELTDDGKGFDVSAVHTGYGLRGMHERVKILGGELKIQSKIDVGTTIKIWIPLINS